MRPLVAVVGPTAVGKSKLAMRLAQNFGGEIVSADSRQVYRYMDIGTAKPNLEERSLIPHHLIDVMNPDQDFSVALYQEMAYRALDDIQGRGKLPFLVGGSGLYVWSVLDGFQMPRVPADPELRRNLEARAKAQGREVLYRELEELDPVAAQAIDPRNIRRIIRALEVCRLSGMAFSQLQQRGPSDFQTLIIGLTTEREDLYRRIDQRVDEMIENGLVEEVRGLVEKGYRLDLPSMSGMGYRQTGMFLKGMVDLPQAVQKIKFETHRLARHQYAWFRHNDERIHWLDIRGNFEETALALVQRLSESRG